MNYILLSLVVASCFAWSAQEAHHCKCQTEFFKSDHHHKPDDRKTIIAQAFEDLVLRRVAFPDCTDQHTHSCAKACKDHFTHVIGAVKDKHGKPATKFAQVISFYGQNGTVGDFACHYLKEEGKVPLSYVYWGMFSRLNKCGQNFTYAGYQFDDVLACDVEGKYVQV